MILDDLKKKLIEYQKAKDVYAVGKLRFLFSEIHNKEIELRGKKEEITDEHVFKVIRKQIKNRKDNIELYEKAGKEDKVAEETKEMEFYMEIAKLFPFELNLEGRPPQK
ncbi:GatB/YqeY domain-containing protein [Patescibacteria group bacterium]